MKKFGGLVLGVAVLAVLMAVGGWYRFPTGAQMTKNEGQLAAFKTCVTDHLEAAYTPEQLSASLSGKDPQASIARNQAMAKISSDCIAASGLGL